MINTDARFYEYLLYGDDNGYGQPQLGEEVAGTVKMAINIASQTVVDSILYKDCSYIGLTHAKVDDTYVILYEGKKLKVMYVNPKGRFKQVFMKEM